MSRNRPFLPPSISLALWTAFGGIFVLAAPQLMVFGRHALTQRFTSAPYWTMIFADWRLGLASGAASALVFAWLVEWQRPTKAGAPDRPTMVLVGAGHSLAWTLVSTSL